MALSGKRVPAAHLRVRPRTHGSLSGKYVSLLEEYERVFINIYFLTWYVREAIIKVNLLGVGDGGDPIVALYSE